MSDVLGPRWSRGSGLAWAFFAAAVVASCIGVPLPTFLARLFFVLVLAGGLVAGAGLLGSRGQVTAAATLLLLVIAQRAIDRPVSEPPSNQWTASLAAGQIIRHTIKLPVDTRQWRTWWQHATGAAAYVCVRGPLSASDGVQLSLNQQLVATITQEQAFGLRPEPTSIGFYRLPLERASLEAQQPSVFELTRAPGADPRPIEVCGTSSYRPTAGLDASAFFDGTRWTSPGLTQHGRFLVEVRIEQVDGDDVRPIAALY
jgi:hypothetical protein